jgi:hypothetical protein
MPRPYPVETATLQRLAQETPSKAIIRLIGENNDPSVHLQALHRKHDEFLTRTTWIPEEQLRAFLDGTHNEEALFRAYLDEEFPSPRLVTRVEWHSNIDRVVGSTGGSGQLFHQEVVMAGTDGRSWEGLAFFLLRAEAQQFQRMLLPALRLMVELGIGGDRSAGRGRFRLLEDYEEIQAAYLTPVDNQDSRVLLLSDTAPEPPLALNDERSAYRVRSARPWSSYHRFAQPDEAVSEEARVARPADWRFLYLTPGSLLWATTLQEYFGAAFPLWQGSPARVILVGFPLFFGSGMGASSS